MKVNVKESLKALDNDPLAFTEGRRNTDVVNWILLHIPNNEWNDFLNLTTALETYVSSVHPNGWGRSASSKLLFLV